MQRLKHIFVWLSRITHCRGFGIQSPTDYWLVRYVINEHWSYYHYAEVGREDCWLRQKMGRLYLRLANWRQPTVVVSDDYSEYFKAGCHKAELVESVSFVGSTLELVRLVANDELDMTSIYNKVDERTVLVVEEIRRYPKLWKTIVDDDRTGVTFDLYYCGIVLFDKKRTKQHYIINF